MPAMKNKAPHTIRISMVWPKSGSITSSDTSSINSPSAIDVAGISGRRADSANSHAASTTNAGLADSDAWMLRPIRVIQRREPLTSGPSSSVATINATLNANTISAERRICRGDRNDTAISTIKDGSRKNTWRLKKWNGSSPILVATGGLAASDRIMPPSISAIIAASSRRSTVHHHSLRGLRCSRESMGLPKGGGFAHLSPMMVSEGLTRWPSYRRKAGIQYAAALAMEVQRLWNTGSPAFAGDDGGEWSGCQRSGAGVFTPTA